MARCDRENERDVAPIASASGVSALRRSVIGRS
jgi:hypothetical protein